MTPPLTVQGSGAIDGTSTVNVCSSGAAATRAGEQYTFTECAAAAAPAFCR